MDVYSKPELMVALDELRAQLGVSVSEDALAAYLAGHEPHTAGYEKLVTPEQRLPAITKYMLVAQGYLEQPEVGYFFDIFRAGRAIPLLRCLHAALRALAGANVVGLGARLKRLTAATDLDAFDSVLFELVVAAAYGQRVGLERIEFVPERPPASSPDLLVRAPTGDIFVECKKFDRMTNASVALRDEARDVSHVVLQVLRAIDTRALVELRFLGRPSETRPDEVGRAALQSLREGGAMQAIAGANVVARQLPSEPLDGLVLYPSPAYFHGRYGYLPDRWHGLVPAMMAHFAGPSFVDEVEWEGAVVWRLEDEGLLWSVKQLGFTRIFEGLEQLASAGRRTVLHVWFERSVEHGHRQEHLQKLVTMLDRRAKDDFSWIIANETLADVSLGGRFEFQEHATPIAGREASLEGPLVANVFVGDEHISGWGEWGIGPPLRPIDEEMEACQPSDGPRRT